MMFQDLSVNGAKALLALNPCVGPYETPDYRGRTVHRRDLEGLAIDHGHEVVGIADSKTSAIDMARSLSIDAALVDIKLRDGFTGPEIAQVLGGELNTPFAFVSGNIELLPPGALGAVGVVQKPFAEGQIVNLLRSLEASSANGGFSSPAED